MDALAALPEAVLLDRLQRGAYSYLDEFANTENGLVADTSRTGSPCSIAVVGFALSCYPVAVKNGWISRAVAAAKSLNVLRFFWNSRQGDQPEATGYKGFYYHFLDMKTGQRVWQCELSLIDTTLLLGGVLAAGCFFDGPGDEVEIRALAEGLYGRVDWQWARNGDATVAQGWKPECGFLHYGWEGYNEATILYVLGAGSPTHPLPAASFAGWTVTYQLENLLGQEVLYSGPLFTHLFSHAWIDFRGIQDDFMRGIGSDYFENTRNSIALHREYGARNPRGYKGYGRDLWGITAGEGPSGEALRENARDRRFFGYTARGVPYGPDDGTIAPWAMLATLPFGAGPALAGTRRFLAAYPQVCSSDRFASGFNPTFTGNDGSSGWLSEGWFGLDQGLLVLMIENYRTGFVWGAHARQPTCPQRPVARRLQGRLALAMPVNSPELPKSDIPDEGDLLRRIRPPDWRNPQPRRVYDLAIVGGGPAGLAAADSAIRLGLRVALVERHWLGGNSLNTGSVPSKTIIRTARVCATVHRASQFGAAPSPELPAEFPEVMARMRRIRARIAEYHSAERLQALGVDVFFGAARFVGPGAVVVGDTPLAFRKALIATGSRPRRLTVPGLEEVGYRTSASIFDLTSLPRRLTVIGGGPLGCELAQAFSRLGSRVTIVQDDPKFLPHEERDASQLLSYALARDGVDTRLNSRITGVREENGVKMLEATSDDAKFSVASEEILLSVGGVPNLEALGLEAAGVRFDTRRGIEIDDFLRTTNRRIHAAGDVCLPYKFTNVAEASARMAVHNAFGGLRRRVSRMTIPWCTYCDPEIAHVGIHVWDAGQRSIPIKSFTVMMQDVDRAITDGQDDGFVKIHVKSGTDRILGATIVASRASEMINEISVAMSTGIGMSDLAEVIHAYPAQSDAIRLAALAYTLDQPVSWLRRTYAKLRA